MAITCVDAQGRVLRVTVKYPIRAKPDKRKQNYVPRGTVHGLSNAARKRLLDKLMRIQWAEEHNKFITLTYPAAYPPTSVSKTHLRAFLERLRRAHPESAAIWRLEFQERGAPHFHLVSPNLPYQNKRSIQQVWGDIIDYPEPFTRIDAFPEVEMVRYISKYCSKRKKEKEDDSVRICNTIKTSNQYKSAWTGRCWGTHNEPSMPYHCRHQEANVGLEVYHTLRERATEVWPALADQGQGSFTLYVDDAAEWAGLLS